MREVVGVTEKGAGLMNNMNEQHFLVEDCPLCGGKIEQMQSEQDHFRSYICPDCGLSWQSCMNSEQPSQLSFPQQWMQLLSQD